jgi:2-hydroxychromene-2-carboxylate isomerase
MKRITFHFDVISPFAYLAFEHLPRALQGLSYEVVYRPVLLGAILDRLGQLGPAEIPGKREWTFRQVDWLARQHGIPLHMPAQHPFNPLPLLRLAIACGEEGTVNRHVAESLLRHVWARGGEPCDPAALQALHAALAPARAVDSDAVKAELRANTEGALANGVFGVPTCEADGRLFWGLDALPMLRASLEGHEWFAGGAWEAAAALPQGVQRPRR